MPQGLAQDVGWLEAEKRIGYLYPKVGITGEIVAGSAGVSPAD